MNAGDADGLLQRAERRAAEPICAISRL